MTIEDAIRMIRENLQNYNNTKNSKEMERYDSEIKKLFMQIKEVLHAEAKSIKNA